jgi:prepilin-type processing-associated H-X9-DG protein
MIQYSQDYDERNVRTDARVTANRAYWGQMIQPYLKSTQILQCPSDTNSTGLPDTGYITAGVADGYPALTHCSYIYNGNLSDLSLAGVVAPSTTVAVTDGGYQGSTTAPFVIRNSLKPSSYNLADPSNGNVNGTTNVGWAAPADRHLETTCVLYADGHVKSQRLTAFYYLNTPWLVPSTGGA